MTNPVVIGDATLFCGDCLEILPTLGKVDAVITDPPYPDSQEFSQYYDGLYKQCNLEFLNSINCLQFIFWSARIDFPLNYSAIHIWDKQVGTGTQYERIFERNGSTSYKVFNHYRHNNDLSARWCNDISTGHPSQKPIRLIDQLAQLTEGIIFDPFMGSGTAGVAALKLGRRFIGIEISEQYFDIAVNRIKKEANQLKLFANNDNTGA